MAFKLKAKKQGRQPKTKLEKVEESPKSETTKTSAITTDIVVLQKATVGFRYVAAPINATGEDLVSVTNVVQAAVIQEYGSKTEPLNLVAITDGARTIRH